MSSDTDFAFTVPLGRSPYDYCTQDLFWNILNEDRKL